MGRRSAGEGTVYRSKNGRWIAMLELPRHPDGRRNRKMRRARTQTEAKRKLTEMRTEYSANGSISSKERMMVDTLSEYLATVRMAGDLARNTLDRDRRFCQTLGKYFSNRRTSDLTVQDCDQFLVDMAEGKVSGKDVPIARDHVRRAKSFLSSALRNDMRLGYLSKNVAEIAVLPPTENTVKPRRALTNSEWRSLFEGAKGTTKLIIDLGGRHGLRPQEIRSIRWADIDFERETLSVVAQFSADDEFTPPKTLRSTRTIKLHAETSTLLKKRQQVQAADRRKNSSIWVDLGLVLTTRRGTAINKDNQRRSLRTLCDRVGIDPITPYELRHTAITHQIAGGFTASQVADWAGTSEKMIFLHYRHQLREIIELPPVDHDAEVETEEE